VEEAFDFSQGTVGIVRVDLNGAITLGIKWMRQCEIRSMKSPSCENEAKFETSPDVRILKDVSKQ
jgi:hypothetical protein